MGLKSSHNGNCDGITTQTLKVSQLHFNLVPKLVAVFKSNYKMAVEAAILELNGREESDIELAIAEQHQGGAQLHWRSTKIGV